MSLPRYAILSKTRVRVISYAGDGYFRVLDNRDTMRMVRRERLTFVH